MRPVDGSISISRPNVPDNKPIDSGKSMVLDGTGKAERYPYLDDFVPHENALRIREARALRRRQRRFVPSLFYGEFFIRYNLKAIETGAVIKFKERKTSL